MMKNYFLLALIFIMATTQQAFAKWEQIRALPASYIVFVAPNGNLIMSDFQYDYSGGLYYSEDKGETWIKADVEDFAYNTIIQAGEYIIASGELCNLARSKDNGVTWELLNYSYMLYDYIEEKAAENDLSYALNYFHGKLFIADFDGAGVMYSEDFGESWTMTDRESLMYEYEGNKYIDSFYKMDVNNDRLLLFSMYFVYRLNEENYTWELLRSDSNFMGVTATYDNTKLVCGRSIYNYTDQVPFLEYTEDGGSTWNAVPRPEGMIDNNVRAMCAFDNHLVVGLQTGGFFYTSDLGETWRDVSDGIPYYLHEEEGMDPIKVYEIPTSMVYDDEYIYMVIYDEPWADGSLSGIYRYSKADLVSGVSTTIDDKSNIFYANNTLYLNANADVNIYNINGHLVLSQEDCTELSISNLQRGVYIYQATINNKVVSGKFVKL